MSLRVWCCFFDTLEMTLEKMEVAETMAVTAAEDVVEEEDGLAVANGFILCCFDEKG